MFPKEPYSQVGGCTDNQTQTTQVLTRYPLPVARVQGYYYVPSNAPGCGSLSHIQTLAGMVRRYVGATSHRLSHAPTHEAKVLDGCRVLCQRLWKEQANGLVPCLRARPRCTLSIAHGQTNRNRSSAYGQRRFHLAPWNGAGLPAPIVKVHES